MSAKAPTPTPTTAASTLQKVEVDGTYITQLLLLVIAVELLGIGRFLEQIVKLLK